MITLLTCFLLSLSEWSFSYLQMWVIINSIHLVTEKSVLMCNCLFWHGLHTEKLGFPTYLNHYSLDHQYQYSLPLQCHYLMKSITFKMMSQMLGIVLCYQYQMIIWLWISLSFWYIRIPCPFLLCCYMQDE